jgi:hypothetical protein
MVVRLPALHAGCALTNFCQRLSEPQGHSAAAKIRYTENSMPSLGIEPLTEKTVKQYQLRPLESHLHL